jgi:ketosteroid isomerase-like protein
MESATFARDTARAMSEENVEIVRRVFEAFSRGGPAAVISGGFLSDEVVFDGTRAEVPGVGVYRGTDEVKAFFEEDWFSAFPFEDWEIHMEEPIDHGDQVIVTSRQQGRGASSGAGGEGTVLALGNIFTLRRGEIVRIQIFRRPEEALAAAGLSE